MPLQNIRAIPHPAGNRIDLSWQYPEPKAYPGVRVVRREGTHPVLPDDGVLVAEGEGLASARDEGLKGETVYYYTLFPYEIAGEEGEACHYHVDRRNRISALTTAPYNFAGQMFDLLPRLYHRYDQDQGQLRRFLNLPGQQLDQLYSLARASLNLHNLDKVDGRMLPLLAQWIGWQTNYRLDVAAQRNELRNAPVIYQTIGIIPTVEATVKRVLGWESRVKEFEHNVFVSNRPERLNLWAQERRPGGDWSVPTAPLSLDYAYEGRPAVVQLHDGTLHLFYHTLRKGRWAIWYKTKTAGGDWSPSQPLNQGRHFDRHPTVAVQKTSEAEAPAETVWIFWDSYDPAQHTWRIDYQIGLGTPRQTFRLTADRHTQPQRRRPSAVVDNLGGLWLFWLEKVGPRWRLNFNRHDGTDWELGTGSTIPVDETGLEPNGESDLFVLFQPAAEAVAGDIPRLWIFWSQKVPTRVGSQTRWQIAYRVASEIDPDELALLRTWGRAYPDHHTLDTTTDPVETNLRVGPIAIVRHWSATYTLPLQNDLDYDDREPTAVLDATGKIELFWSSNRADSWAIWHGTLNPDTNTWETPVSRVSSTLYAQRSPVAITFTDSTLLIYRSNQNVSYASSLYKATETVDFRYTGSTTVDTRTVSNLALRGQFEDFQSYIYDAGQRGKRTNLNWYARDTVGIYLTPDTDDKTLVRRNRALIENILRQFLPIQVRTVFIIEPVVYREPLYTYDFPEAEPPRLIGEKFFDSTLPETYTGLADTYRDTIDWVWFRTWSEAYRNHLTVDVDHHPKATKHRTWHTGLEIEEE